ncbi:TolC family protein [Desulfogranum marinum]|uniref:TolC family protein n=1 Tax=Desulfogranum marinum TaxID=453220 RepID=UPI0029C718A4|nr:TolC family protein [Desulfogranum marinum]
MNIQLQIPSIILFLLLALPFSAPAKDSQETNPALSLEQAVLIALKNNPALHQQINTVKSAEVIVSQRQADFYPDLSLKTTGSEDLDMNVELSSSVNLFRGFADTAALQNSELLVKAEQENLSREEQTLMFETVSLFIEVLTNQEFIGAREMNLEENKKLLGKIRAFHEAGKLPVSDLYQQQAETKQAEQDLLEAQHNLTSSKLTLMQTMGMVPTDRYTPALPELTKLSLELPDEEIDRLTRLALENRSDIKARKHQVDAAEQQIREAKAGKYPTVDLVAAMATDYSGYWDDFMDENLGSTVGVTVSLPLFDRFETRNNTVLAQIEKRNEKLTLQEKELQIGLEVAQAVQDLKQARQKIDVVESKLTYAKRALESYEERYRVGASTLVELIQTRTQYITAIFDQVEAKYDLVTREMTVAYSLGELGRMLATLLPEEIK